jgi:tRNA wybutosine-synthesizing protein 3
MSIADAAVPTMAAEEAPSVTADGAPSVSKRAAAKARRAAEQRARPPKPKGPRQPVNFDVAKRNALTKLDKSPKGSIDAPARELVAAINACAQYVTTSCCSGRVSLYETYEDMPSASWLSAGRGGKWLLVRHDTVTLEQLVAALPSAAPADGGGGGGGGMVSLKVEPAIFHVQCRDLPAARALLQMGLRAGFRESGIVLSETTKVMVAIRTTANCLELPVYDGTPRAGAAGADAAGSASSAAGAGAGEAGLLVSREYLSYLVGHANSKYLGSIRRLEALAAEFAKLDGGVAVCAPCDEQPEPDEAQPPPTGARRCRSRSRRRCRGAAPSRLSWTRPTVRA